jgi:methylase of polypeptide subunit release factors
MCCGAGPVAAVLAAQVPGVEVWAVDVDPVAVRCARRNLPDGRVLLGDLFDPLPADLRGRVGVLVANAPYVPSEEVAFMPAEARLHEARVALDGGPDGLDVQRRVIAAAPEWLAPGGTLLVETSRRQAPGTAAALTAAAWPSTSSPTRTWTPPSPPAPSPPSNPPGSPPGPEVRKATFRSPQDRKVAFLNPRPATPRPRDPPAPPPGTRPPG